jgi:hypothetical protein
MPKLEQKFQAKPPASPTESDLPVPSRHSLREVIEIRNLMLRSAFLEARLEASGN